MATRYLVLNMYRKMLHSANRFATYNYREYFKRRIREEFKKHKSETDPDCIRKLLQRAVEENKVLERQAAINSMFAKDDLVISVAKKKTRNI